MAQTPGRKQSNRAHTHNHRACIAEALTRAREVCAAEGARLTPLREQVLGIVWRSHRPIGAYEVLDRLVAHRKGARPPTVYRALDFLLARGLIHKIESLNAYLGCAATDGDHDGDHDGQFLICRKCGNATELHDRKLEDAIGTLTRRTGFRPEHRVIELSGLCAGCAA